jgi:amino acid adenylation domain-containing protein
VVCGIIGMVAFVRGDRRLLSEDDLFLAGKRLDQIFEARAHSYPGRVAIVSGDDTATYADVDHYANVLARRLTHLGVAPNVLVGLYLERGIGLIAGILGILRAGGAYLPIDANIPPPRVNWLLRDSGARIVVTSSSLAGRITDRSVALLLADRDAADRDAADRDAADRDAADRDAADRDAADRDAADRDADPVPGGTAEADGAAREPGRGAPGTTLAAESAPTDLAYVIYTSGSTGTPKGVLVEHRNVVRLFEVTRRWFHFDEHDVWTMFHSVAFDFSVWEIWGALLFGGRLIVVPDEICRSPARFRDLLEREQVTVLNHTPSAFHQLDAADRGDVTTAGLRHLRLVVFGGERLNTGMLTGWIGRRGDRQPALVNMYGVTETTVHASYRPIRHADLSQPDRSPIGVPLPDLRFHVLNAAGERSAAGEPGELYITGAGVSRGYLNRADLTSDRFVARSLANGERAYRTGDLVVADQAGEYFYLGRVDDQIKIRGYRVEPREIELVLETHPEVAASVVIPHDYGDGDMRLVAYLVRTGPGDNSVWAERVRSALADKLAGLPAYMRPAAFVPIPALPLTANGKVDRAALPPPIVAAQAPLPEVASVQSRIAAIWAEILNVSAVRPDEDFFDLGGTSLALIRMLDRINTSFGTDIGVEIFVDEATASSLAKTLDSSAAGKIDRTSEGNQLSWASH